MLTSALSAPQGAKNIKGTAFQKNFGGSKTQGVLYEKTKWLAACMAAAVLALVAGCSNGNDDEPDLLGVVEKDGWLMEGSMVRQYLGSEEKVTIPAGATIIGRHAFKGTGVKEVTIGNGVTVIEYSAFSNCTSFTSVTIPDSVTIPASVESIGSYAFSGCASLASVTIPASVESIGYNAFYGCDSLTEVKYGGTEEQWKQIVIGYGGFPSSVKITDKDGREISNQ